MSDPLGLYSHTQATQPPQNDPLGLYSTGAQPDGSTAVGRRDADMQNTQQLIQRLQGIKPTDQAHKERIDRMIQNMQASLPHGPLGAVRGSSANSGIMDDLTNLATGNFGAVRPIDTGALKQNIADAAHGAAAGVIKGLMQPADVAAAIPAAVGFKPAQALRSRIAEANAAVDEEINPTGGGGIGAVGDLGGNILSSAEGFGAMSNIAKAAILRYAPESLLSKAILSSATAGSGIASRVVAQVASGLPIQVSAALGTPGPWRQKLTQLGIGVGADALFGGMHEGELPPGHTAPEGTATAGMADAVAPSTLSPERTAQLQEAQAKAAAKAAAKLQDKIDARQARAEWQAANPDLDYRELAPLDRKKIIADYQERLLEKAVAAPVEAATSESNTNLDGSIRPPDEVATAIVGQNPITPEEHAVLVGHLNDLVDDHDAALHNGNEAQATDISQQAQAIAATLDGTHVQEPEPEPAAVAPPVAAPEPEAAPVADVAPRTMLETVRGDKALEDLSPEQLDKAHAYLQNRLATTTDPELGAKISSDMNKIDSFRNPSSHLVTGTNTVGAGFDPSLLTKLGANMYKGDIASVAVKEGLQNAIDSVRGTEGGRVDIGIASNGRTIDIQDNGHGMTPDIARNEFMDVGGSAKGDGASGGYGLAKVGLLSNAKQFIMHTVADVDGQRKATMIEGTAADWANGTLRVHTDDVSADTPTGTTLRILFNDDVEFNPWAARDFADRATKANRTGADIRVHDLGNDNASTEPFEVTPNPRDHLQLDDESKNVHEVPGASIDFIPTKDNLRPGAAMQTHVLNNGLYQFSTSHWNITSADAPAALVVDVHPKVDVENSKYPFTTSREELKGEAFRAVQEYIQDIGNQAGKKETQKLIQAIETAPEIPFTDAKVYDGSKIIRPEVVDQIAKSDYAYAFIDAWKKVSDAIEKATTDKFARVPAFDIGGMTLDQGHLGVNISRKILKDIAERNNEDLSHWSDKPLILINPFVTYAEVQARAVNARVNSFELAARLANENWSTLVHEIAHQFSRGHHEEFAGALTRMLGATASEADKNITLLTRAWEGALGDRMTSDFINHYDEVKYDWIQSGGQQGNILKKLSAHQSANIGGDVSGAASGEHPSWDDIFGTEGDGKVSGHEQPADGTDIQRDGPAGGTDTQAETPPAGGPEVGNGGDGHTFLDTIKHPKPLEEMTEPQLDRLENKLFDRIEKLKEGTPEYMAVEQDILKMLDNQQRLNTIEGQASKPVEGPAPVMPAEVVHDQSLTGTSAINFEQKVHEAQEAIKPPGLSVLRSQKAQSLSQEALNSRIGMLNAFLKDKPLDDPMAGEYRKVLDKALEERALRADNSRGVVAHMPPGVVGAAAGFTYGYMSAPDDTDRYTNALDWALIGAGAGYLAGRRFENSGIKESLVKPTKAVDLPGGGPQYEIKKFVVHSDARRAKPVPFMERMRDIYQGTVRRSYGVERWQQAIGGAKVSVQNNAAKLIAMAGRWAGQTENALKYGPSLVDEFGAIKHLGAMGVSDILDLVKGDSDGLGELMAARTKVELGDQVKTPFSTELATFMFHSMPENYHQAADAARQFSLSMADVLVDAGILSQKGRDAFANESMYAALQRVFKFDTGSQVSAEKVTKAIVRAANPLKAREGGGEELIRNPFEVMVQSVPQYYRAAEQNKIKVAMVNAWEAAGMPSEFMARTSKKTVDLGDAHDAQILALQKEGFGEQDAKAMVAGFSDIDDKGGKMRVYRNGDIETYTIPKNVATALQTLNPEEIGVLTKLLGYPSRLASKGITMNPYFMGKMALFDTWQATLNSQYGFRFGLDNMRGWYHIMKQTPEYQDFMAAGGGHQNLYQSQLGLAQTIEGVKGSLGSPLENAVKQVRELHPIQAYKSLIAPLADAARVGEYMRALDHGESVLQAVWAARQVTANYSEIGSFSQMRALQHMTMFLGPAMQVMDQAAYRGGIHPFRAPEEGRLAAAANYATKAFITVTLPSLYFWMANKDDKQINELRQTQTGRKYWFTRAPTDISALGISKGDILKIPKPPLDGQVFGTSMESALDQHYRTDPGGQDQVVTAILRDAAFNILPQAGLIPYSLSANQDLGLGRAIIPVGDDQLELQYQGADKASWLARAISSKIAPSVQNNQDPMLRNAVTPAGLDFLVNSVGGMLGQDAVQAISQAVETQTKGYIPSAQELPILQRIVAPYPSMNTRSVERFYENYAKVDIASKTMKNLLNEHPENAMDYYERNQQLIALAPVFDKQRQTIANLRRGILDTKNAPASVMASDAKRAQIKTFVQYINDIAGMTNEYTQKLIP